MSAGTSTGIRVKRKDNNKNEEKIHIVWRKKYDVLKFLLLLL